MSDIAAPARRRRPTIQDALLRYGLLTIAIVVFLVFVTMAPGFSSASNIYTILRSVGIAAIMYLGATWVLACGEIDVSFMQIAAVATMIVALALQLRMGWPAAMVLALLAGVVFGALNGVLVAYLRLPSLIVTIATGGVALATATAMGTGSAINITSTGMVGQILAWRFGVVPTVLVLALVCYAIAWYVQERLVFGHYIFALADNRNSLVEAGVPAGRLVMLVFVMSGITSAIAGIILAAELASGQPRIGDSYFLDGLTAILLGSMALRPGQANVLGTLIGVFLMTMLVSGTALVGWLDWQQQLFRGFLLLTSIVVIHRPGKAARFH